MGIRYSERADTKPLIRAALIGLAAIYAVLVIIDIPLSDSAWLVYCLGIPYCFEFIFNSYVPFYIVVFCQFTLLVLAIRSMRPSVIIIALSALALNALGGYVLFDIGKAISEALSPPWPRL